MVKFMFMVSHRELCLNIPGVPYPLFSALKNPLMGKLLVLRVLGKLQCWVKEKAMILILNSQTMPKRSECLPKSAIDSAPRCCCQ